MGVYLLSSSSKIINMEAISQESVMGVPDPSGARKSGRHPAYNVMVRRAILALKAKSGSSRKSIVRYICAHYNVKKSNALKAVGRALKRMVKAGLLYKSKAGSYKLTGKGRTAKKRRKTRRRKKASKKAGRRRNAAKKSKKSKKSKKAKKAKKSKKPRKVRRSRRNRRKSVKKTTKRRKASKKQARKGRKSTRRRRYASLDPSSYMSPFLL